MKGIEPRSLTEHRASPGATYSDFAGIEDLRRALVAEQRSLCCYCMKRIRPEFHGMKVEHWHPQSLFHEEQLAYWNLLGACNGGEGQPFKELTCDSRKQDRLLSRNPANPAHRIESYIKFFGDGRIGSTNSQLHAELGDILNLNHWRLVRNRKSVLEAFVRSLPRERALTVAKLHKMMDYWSGASGAELPEYAAVVVYWLRKRLARV